MEYTVTMYGVIRKAFGHDILDKRTIAPIAQEALKRAQRCDERDVEHAEMVIRQDRLVELLVTRVDGSPTQKAAIIKRTIRTLESLPWPLYPLPKEEHHVETDNV
jgi:hypothetical protein